jgi:AhpD family alkylhydroperoxidase
LEDINAQLCFNKKQNIMSNRTKMDVAEPNGYKALLALEAYIGRTLLTTKHKDLIKIRASQINGCAFCIDMHTKDARKAGETEQRIYALNAWRDTPFFDEQERAILALTEEVTLISNHVSDETYNNIAALFDQTYVAQLIMAIITINAWNRMAITTHLEPAF